MKDVIKCCLLFLLGMSTLYLFDGCSTARMEVLRYDAEKAQNGSAFVYYLPQTVIDFDFAVVYSHYTPGPYAQYCEKFLGISGIATESNQNCQIAGVKATTHQEVDMRYPFLAILRHQAAIPAFLQLAENGLLMPSDAAYPQGGVPQMVSTTQQPYCYTDLSSYPFIDLEKNVFHSVVQKDTSFVSVPVTREVTIKRSLEEKAQQAAEQIFTLRKRRIELLLGDDMPTTADGIPTMLREIARLEAEYLSLFIGRTTHDTVHFRLSHTPTLAENSTILCRFSDAKGIVSSSDMTASPLLIQVMCESKETLELESLRPLQDAYYYRTAVPAQVQLSLDGANIYQGRLAISQYGRLMHVPIQLRVANAN